MFPHRRAASWVAFVSFFFSSIAFASSAGISGESGRDGSTCARCHTGGGTATATLTGPTNVQGGTTQTYTFTIMGGPGVVGGLNVTTDSLFAQLKPVTAGVKDTFNNNELSHDGGPLSFAGGRLVVQFQMVAPAGGGTVKIYAAGVSANNNGGLGGDAGAGTTLTVSVTGNGSGGAAPLIASPAAGTPSPVTGKTATLTVLGNDDGGEAALAYAWTATGPGPVSFAPNGTNAAKKSTATFSKPGTYNVVATIRDAGGQTVTSAAAIVVQAAVTALAISPQTAGVAVNGTQKFTASALDQFGNAISPAPTVNWSIPFGGTVDQTGLFTAGPSAGGPFTVVAAAGGLVASAQVSVGNGRPPTFARQPAAVLSGTKAALSVLGTDDSGESGLSYQWRLVTGPGTVTFSPNGNNSAKNTTATFSGLGTFTVEVLATDKDKLTASTTLVVSVDGSSSTGPQGTDPQAVDSTDGVSGGCTASSSDLEGASTWTVLVVLAIVGRRRLTRRA